ncbi:MAG: hypothetical protein ACFE8O_08965 [Candidatus Hermodarchaeota archaeon]
MVQISLFLLIFAIDSLVAGVLPALILWQILIRWSKNTSKLYLRIAVLCIVVVQSYFLIFLIWKNYVPYTIRGWSLLSGILPFLFQFLVYIMGSYILFDMNLQQILIFSVIGLFLSMGFLFLSTFVNFILLQVGIADYFNPNLP